MRGWKGRFCLILRRMDIGQGLLPRLSDLHPSGCHLSFDGPIPMGICHLIFQQPIALTHGFFIGEHLLTVIWIKRKRHAIQKPPATLRAFNPKTVHRRDQPQDTRNAPQHDLSCRFAINPQLTRRTILRPGLYLMHTILRAQNGRDLPAQRFRTACHFFRTRPPDATAGRKQGNRL